MLSYVLWPFVITAGTGATYLGLESGYPLPAVFFAVGAGMLARVLVAEQWIPRRPDWNALADRQSINDLGHALVANLLGERVGELVFLTLAASAAGGLTAEHHDHARRAPLVGLVRVLPKRPSERQQSGEGSCRRRPLHGGGSSCSSQMTPFEWPHSPSTSTAR